jgi:hypothetical protein
VDAPRSRCHTPLGSVCRISSSLVFGGVRVHVCKVGAGRRRGLWEGTWVDVEVPRREKHSGFWRWEGVPAATWVL